ncbi:hypothetical protein CKM354_000968700 [Cercospora kikuchii]|uniref:Uncharacterized protein n=1 Tax=Cercospora kikuchii TaxID=84275 RepID=A0A9P3CPI1_9PEZI|nr:uncharacterized protein CKM354_000968700 [Cercospora kikuchii]GIZ46564.1 hypothetical protein CKM354_000968700 [Cercospora kikuchii]
MAGTLSAYGKKVDTNTLGELRETVAPAFEEEAEGTTPPQRVLGALTRYLKATKQHDEDLPKLAPAFAAQSVRWNQTKAER